MTQPSIGQQYDRIAAWWQAQHRESGYGVTQVERALRCAGEPGNALDVGCGAGGRLLSLIEAAGFAVTGVDASAEMIALAAEEHPLASFIQADIQSWESDQKYDFILAWDCLFHLPLQSQAPVLTKLCGLLSDQGILIYTFGDAVGEHQDEWRNQTFNYSSIGIDENIRVLRENGVTLRHLELDQFPEKHAYIIGQKV